MITQWFKQHGLKLITEPTDKRFLCVDDGGVECETGELLYGFLRRIKPQWVLETGCYTGVSALYMAKALQDNNFGHLHTLEYETIHIDRAQKLWGQFALDTWVTPVRTDSMKFTPQNNYQFMFLDTELHLRYHELVRFYPYLDDGGFILIHDMNRTLCQGNVNTDHPDFKHWPVGELPPEFKDLLKTRKLMPFFFGGARGIAGYYKLHKDDYV